MREQSDRSDSSKREASGLEEEINVLKDRIEVIGENQ
jgi:hypothetical protein